MLFTCIWSSQIFINRSYYKQFTKKLRFIREYWIKQILWCNIQHLFCWSPTFIKTQFRQTNVIVNLLRRSGVDLCSFFILFPVFYPLNWLFKPIFCFKCILTTPWNGPYIYTYKYIYKHSDILISAASIF